MDWTLVISVIFVAIISVGSVFFVYQLYKIIVIDAKTREMQHPRLWGLLGIGKNTGTGLIFYFIIRRNHPVVSISNNQKLEIANRKKYAGVGLAFVVLGTIGLMSSTILF